jgi:hypothetical protein
MLQIKAKSNQSYTASSFNSNKANQITNIKKSHLNSCSKKKQNLFSNNTAHNSPKLIIIAKTSIIIKSAKAASTT